jgi:hypothetical protein
MMVAMTTYNPLSISLFTASWTVGMAAMMFSSHYSNDLDV